MNTFRAACKGAFNLILRRYAGPFWYRRHWLRRTERYSHDEIAVLQTRLWECLVKHCLRTVPYYRAWAEREGLNFEDLRSLEGLTRFPVLTKDDIRRAGSALHSRVFPRFLCHRAYTGGTTGPRLALQRDWLSIGNEQAFVRRQFDWAGLGLRDACAYLTWRSVAPPNDLQARPFVYDPVMRELILSTFHLGPETMDRYCRAMSRYRVKALVGYPSAIGEMARRIVEEGKTMPLQAVLTSSETLTPTTREQIEQAFGCPVYDFYGSAERVCYIHTCEQGSYHIVPEYGITELIPCEPPNEDCSRIVATGFWNRAMPLIRYDTGDLVVPSEAGCSCGRAFPVVEAIQGRLSHTFTTSTGRTVGLTALARLFKNVLMRLKELPIEDCQFVYNDNGGIQLQYIPDSSAPGDINEDIHAILRQEFPEDMQVGIVSKTEFGRTPSGKAISLARS